MFRQGQATRAWPLPQLPGGRAWTRRPGMRKLLKTELCNA